MSNTVWNFWVAPGCTEVFKDDTTRTKSAFLGQGLGLLPIGWDPVLGFFFCAADSHCIRRSHLQGPLVMLCAISPKTYYY